MSQFLRTLILNIKRSIKITPKICLYTLLFLLVTSTVVIYGSKLFFSGAGYDNVNVALYLPDDSRYNSLGLSFVENMESFQESVNIINVSSEEEGKEMLKNNEALVFIDIPEGFVNSVLTGENLDVKIIFKNNDTLDEHIVNDLIISLSNVLGTAQASVYTLGDIQNLYGVDPEIASEHYVEVDTNNFKYVLSRENAFEERIFESLSRFSLQQNMAAAYLLLILFFSCFSLGSFYKSKNTSYMLRQNAMGLKKCPVVISEILATTIPIYISSLIIMAAFSIGGIRPKAVSLLTMIPVSLLVSTLIALSFTLIKNRTYACLALFIGVILIMYISGGLIPMTLLPGFMKNIATYNPFYHLIQFVLTSMF